jgi:hypothetical protein
MIVFFSFLFGATLMGLYIWWFSVRYRRDKRREAEQAERDAAAASAIFDAARSAEQSPTPGPAPSPSPLAARSPALAPAEPSPSPAAFERAVPPPVAASPSPAPSVSAPLSVPTGSAPLRPATGSSSREATVAEALAGIALPNGLAPLTSMTDAGTSVAGDRVVFWTDTAPADVVGHAFKEEVERLGFTVTRLDDQTVALRRDPYHLAATIYPDAGSVVVGKDPLFPTVPVGAVVLEVRVTY